MTTEITKDHLEEVRRLRKNISLWNLHTADNYPDATDVQVARAYNGAGPDKWFAWLRAIITFFLRRFREAVLLHDWRFEYSDGTLQGWRDANKEMLDNMVGILDIKYPSWFQRPLYWFWYKRAYEAYLALLTENCYSNWISASKKQLQDPEYTEEFPNTKEEEKLIKGDNHHANNKKYDKGEYR